MTYRDAHMEAREQELARLIREQAADDRLDRVWSVSLDENRVRDIPNSSLANRVDNDGNLPRLGARKRRRCPIHGLSRMGIRSMGRERGYEEYCRLCNIEAQKRWRAKKKRSDPDFMVRERARVREYRRFKRINDPEWREKENARQREHYHRMKEGQDG